MATQTLAPGATLPPGFTIPPGATLPPDFTIPPGLSIPPGLTLAPGTTIPPGLLNGNATTGGVTDGPNTNTATGADNNGFGDINLGSFNATPFFLPAPIRTYERAGATTGMAGIPRFGHNSDFANVAYLASSTNKADGEDYIVGLMFAGCFLLVFFLVWTIVLIIFKVAMSGFLSGEPFMNPHIHDPVTKQAKEDAKIHGREYKEDNSWLKRPRRIRITFFFCGLIQIIFAILLVNQGMANLQQTTDTIQVSSESIRLLVKEADGVALNLKQVGDTGLILRDQVVFDLNKDNFCPGNPLFVQTSIGQSLIGASDGAAQMLNQLGDFVTNNVATLEESLAATEQQLDSLDRSMAEAESYEWLAGLIAFPYMLLASLMILGAFAAQLDAMTECFLCMLNWVILPLYIFVTIFSYIVLAVAAIAASLNADFCGGETSSPDQVLVDLLFRSGFQEDGLLFQTVRYYAYQCTARAEVDPFMFLRSFDGVIVQGRELVQNLTQSMDDISLQQLSLGCNRDFRPLHRSLGQMLGVLDALLQAANRAINLLRCQRLVPFYTDIIYDATCTYSVTGFAWIFSCLLLVSITGMIMIMFRASYQNTIYEGPPNFTMEDNSNTPLNDRTEQDGGENDDHFDDEDL